MNEIALTTTEIDWIESKTAGMLLRAKRSRWFKSIIIDAKELHADGYAWDIALAMSCEYWLLPDGG